MGFETIKRLYNTRIIDTFFLSRYLCSHQGSTPSLANFVNHPPCFLTAYKSYDVLPVLAGKSDSKNKDPYYYNTKVRLQIELLSKEQIQKNIDALFFKT